MSDIKRHFTRRLRVVALAPNSWNGQWVNRQQLMSRLGIRHSILYSTGGWFSWDRHSPEWRSARFFGTLQSDQHVHIDHSPKYLMRFPRAKFIDEFVLRWQANRWRTWLAGLGKGPLVAHLFHPVFFPYLKHLHPDFVVYHAYDLFHNTPGWNEQLASNERRLLERADLVVASSQLIAEGMSEVFKRDIKVLPNGADVASFDMALRPDAAEPDDLANIPHPRIGYLGSLHPQVDYDLVSALAKREPSWQFVLIGQVVSSQGKEDQSLAECRQLQNIHLLGAKPHRKIPNYAVNMDANIMCYRLNEGLWIKAGYPLKLHEYLASGKPVISSDLASVRPFSEVVRICSGPEDWHGAIHDALHYGGRGSGAARRAVARENSWDARAEKLEQWWLEAAEEAERAS